MHFALSLLTRGFVSPFQQISEQVAQVPLPPAEAQTLLVKSLELPLPTALTEPMGVFQSDIIIRTMIVAAIADMRANPWLLDYVFASLPRDALTLKDYGENEVSRAKEWFAKTEIKVLLGARVPDGDPPPVCVSIHMLSSSEQENTLADVHHKPSEDTEALWPALSAKFDPVSYSAATGIMVLPATVTDNMTVATGMVIVDRSGRSHPVLDVLSENTIVIKSGTIADFHECFVKSAQPSLVASLESASFKEAFAIGCHCVGEAVHLTYLHSVIVFAFLRYRQALLESRGFERSFIESGDFKLEAEFLPEIFFSRYINLAGYVRQYWPKSFSRKVLSFDAGIRVTDGENAPIETSGGTTDELSWIGEQDSSTFILE